MEIKGPNLNSYPPDHSRFNPSAKQFYSGQVLKAVVVEINSNKVLFDLLEPKISLKFEAEGKSDFKPGQIVSLQVIKPGPPLSLNVLDNTNTNSKTDNIINSALKFIIPKQTSMSQLLSNLHYISKVNPKPDQYYTQEITELSKKVLHNLTTIKDLQSTAGVKKAIESSGIFLEQHIHKMLSNRSNFPTNDTRVNLLRLAESIRNTITETPRLNNQATLYNIKSETTPNVNSNQLFKAQYLNPTAHQNNSDKTHFHISDLQRIPSNLNASQQSNSILNELLRNIESSLSKIQYNQLQHFISDDSSKSNWFIDLPIRHDDGSDIIHFRFSKNNDSDYEANDNKWSVTLSFSLEKLGDISIQLYLQNNKVGATVWASTNDTYNLFNQYLPDLQLQMENSGITVSNLRCNKGEIIHLENEKSTNILDEKV